MSNAILIDKDGNLMNPGSNIITPDSDINGIPTFSLWWNQLSLECFDEIITQPSGLITADTTSVVKNPGLSGTLTFNIWPTTFAPNTVTISPSNVLDLSNAEILQWQGGSGELEIIAAGITGCNYINIILSRAIRSIS